jgi:hypothetical protein
MFIYGAIFTNNGGETANFQIRGGGFV